MAFLKTAGYFAETLKEMAPDTKTIKEGTKKAAQATKEGTLEVASKATHGIQNMMEESDVDERLEVAVNEYNEAYNDLNETGVMLHYERVLAVDLIDNIEMLINSIPEYNESFEKEFEAINVEKAQFTSALEFAERENEAARKAKASRRAGKVAKAGVTSLAPSAAMWVATTFGTASTGAAISTLSGVAAQNAALAWLGGGALAAGGGGMAAGNALLALAGPIGWSIAGVTLFSSVVIFSKEKEKLKEEKENEIESLKKNTETVKETDERLEDIFDKTVLIRKDLKKEYGKCMTAYGKELSEISPEVKVRLEMLLDKTKELADLLVAI